MVAHRLVGVYRAFRVPRERVDKEVDLGYLIYLNMGDQDDRSRMHASCRVWVAFRLSKAILRRGPRLIYRFLLL